MKNTVDVPDTLRRYPKHFFSLSEQRLFAEAVMIPEKEKLYSHREGCRLFLLDGLGVIQETDPTADEAGFRVLIF